MSLRSPLQPIRDFLFLLSSFSILLPLLPLRFVVPDCLGCLLSTLGRGQVGYKTEDGLRGTTDCAELFGAGPSVALVLLLVSRGRKDISAE